MDTTRLLGLSLCLILASGCQRYGFLVKQESECNCPTDIRQMVPWCAGEDAIFHCPCGPNEEFYGYKPTCWGVWPAPGAEWRDAHCGPLQRDHCSRCQQNNGSSNEAILVQPETSLPSQLQSITPEEEATDQGMHQESESLPLPEDTLEDTTPQLEAPVDPVFDESSSLQPRQPIRVEAPRMQQPDQTIATELATVESQPVDLTSWLSQQESQAPNHYEAQDVATQAVAAEPSTPSQPQSLEQPIREQEIVDPAEATEVVIVEPAKPAVVKPQPAVAKQPTTRRAPIRSTRSHRRMSASFVR